ncbi:MAG: hypothetical protein RMI49_01490 [Candidatus Caldarchaeum sp.]|nr:hypothetical protein [Candidatus Caldarchaeum sp.]
MLGNTFIVVWEGVDGSGKTTLLNAVARRQFELGYSVETYKTPSNSPTGLFAQQHGNTPTIDSLTRMFLFLANTSDDSRVIRRLIEEKKPDFLHIDRYYLCSVVYGFSLTAKRNSSLLDAEKFKKFFETIEELGTNVFVGPDLVIIVTVDPQTRKQRTAQKTPSSDIQFERDEELQERVEHYYNVYSEWRPHQVWKIFNPENMVDVLSREISDRLISLRRRSLGG